MQRESLKERIVLWLGITFLISVCGVILLPIALVLSTLPFELENTLFGTSYLFNVLPHLLTFAYWPIEIGWLLFPLLGVNKAQRLWLASISYIVFPLILYASLGIVSMADKHGPRETVGPVPIVVKDSLPVQGVHTLKWSPDGQLIALMARDKVVNILDVETWSEISQIDQAPNLTWSADNRLWILAEDHWDVYERPYTSIEQLPLGYERKDSISRMSFEPNSQTLAVVELSDDKKFWLISIWREGVPVYTVTLRPRYGTRDWMQLSFSPDGNSLMLVMSGWMNYEQPGPEEMWLLDVSKGKVRFIHEGKTNAWQIWDYSVQRLSPAWGRTSDEVVFGDARFGVERVNLRTRRVARVLGAGYGARNIQVSAKGDWIAFERQPDRTEDDKSCSRCFGVTNRNGKRAVYLPGDYLDQSYIKAAWHPEKPMLAIISRNSHGNDYLLLWDLSDLEK